VLSRTGKERLTQSARTGGLSHQSSGRIGVFSALTIMNGEIREELERTLVCPRYLIRPYYLIPDGKVGHDALR
jgi:hypothetical protein